MFACTHVDKKYIVKLNVILIVFYSLTLCDKIKENILEIFQKKKSSKKKQTIEGFIIDEIWNQRVFVSV